MLVKTTKTVKNPRISINKLGEYLEANPSRRKKIIYDAKYPQGFIGKRYNDARNCIKKYLIHGYTEDYILAKIEFLKNKKYLTTWQKDDAMASINALKSFLATDLSSIDTFEYDNLGVKPQLIPIKGVNISVDPDLFISKVVGKNSHVGLIKLHFGSSSKLTDESQKVVASMLFFYANNYHPIKSLDISKFKLCLSYDVFKKGIQISPSSLITRMKHIEDACEEIALRWDSV